MIGAVADDLRRFDEGARVGDDEVLGAITRLQRAATARRGSGSGLEAALSARADRHAPLVANLHSEWKDSTQICVTATRAISLLDYQGVGPTFAAAIARGSLSVPVVSGKTRVYKKFKPEKAVLTQWAGALYVREGAPGVIPYFTTVANAGDVLMISAYSGADNCFPNAPDLENAIHGPVFSNTSLGVGISWPTLDEGIDFSAAFGILPTIIGTLLPPVQIPSQGISLVDAMVQVRLTLLGPSLR